LGGSVVSYVKKPEQTGRTKRIGKACDQADEENRTHKGIAK